MNSVVGTATIEGTAVMGVEVVVLGRAGAETAGSDKPPEMDAMLVSVLYTGAETVTEAPTTGKLVVESITTLVTAIGAVVYGQSFTVASQELIVEMMVL